MPRLLLLYSLNIFFFPNLLSAFCENPTDYSLNTFQWSEQYTRKLIRKEWLAKDLAMKVTDLEYIEWDLAGAKKLFFRGYMTLDQLEGVELGVDETRLNLKMKQSDLEAFEGDLNIFKRNIESSCGRDPLPIEEIAEVAKIFIAKWEAQLENDLPQIDIGVRRLAMAVRYFEFQEKMLSRGYISKRKLMSAEYSVLLEQRNLNARKAEVHYKRDYIQELSDLLDAV